MTGWTTSNHRNPREFKWCLRGGSKQANTGESAIGAEDLPGGEAGGVGKEEVNEFGDVIRVADLLEGVSVGCGVAAFLIAEQGCGEFGIGEGGGDGVDADFGGPLGGEGFGEAFDGAFGRGDAGVEGHAGVDGNGAEEDDGGGGGLFEGGEGLLEDLGGPEEVDLKVVKEVFCAQAVEGFEIDGAGAVDEAVQGVGEVEVGGLRCVEGLRRHSKGGELIMASRGGVDMIALGVETFRNGEADPRVAADEKNGACHGALCAGWRCCLSEILVDRSGIESRVRDHGGESCFSASAF